MRENEIVKNSDDSLSFYLNYKCKFCGAEFGRGSYNCNCCGKVGGMYQMNPKLTRV